jgi:hypothetical protein
MKHERSLILALAFSAAASVGARDAAACGGCFHEGEATQVVGHRMIFSVSKSATTLWDQIKYSGDPQSFAWVLPVKGQVTVGLSSDALFQVLDQTTQVYVTNPSLPCLQGGPDNGGNGGGGGGGGGGGVTVVNEMVVGPYETVQLSSQDPNALSDWLKAHSYIIPASIEPVIAAYVKDGFDFLALKLVPGQGVDSMKPVRVTSPGAGAVLPLRMVAAGTGVSTAVQLWVFAEGRYEPQNFPSFLIQPKDVVWNWDTKSSNYSMLREQGWSQGNGSAWLTDYAAVVPSFLIKEPIQSQGLDQYADDKGMNAQQNLDADMAALYGSLDPNNLWISHLSSKLSQAAFANDLQLQASADQSPVSNFIEAGSAVGTPPCSTGGSGAGGAGGTGGAMGGAGGAGGSGAGGNGAGGKGGRRRRSGRLRRRRRRRHRQERKLRRERGGRRAGLRRARALPPGARGPRATAPALRRQTSSVPPGAAGSSSPRPF